MPPDDLELHLIGQTLFRGGFRIWVLEGQINMPDYPCTAINLAHYIVDKCTNDKHPVSNLQLQKMLYFLQSVYCMSSNGLLFEDTFEAWPYGPVLPYVYREYSRYGGRKIEAKYRDIPSFPEEIKGFIDGGIEVLRTKSPWDLVRTTHAPNSPWDQVYRNGSGYKETIPNSLIVSAAQKDSR